MTAYTTLREAILSVPLNQKNNPLARFIIGLDEQDNDNHSKIIDRFAAALEEKFGYTQFSIAEGKSGGYGFLLNVFDQGNETNILLRITIPENGQCNERLLHSDILQPIFSRTFTSEIRQKPFILELVVNVDEKTPTLNGTSLSREMEKRLALAGLEYSDDSPLNDFYSRNDLDSDSYVCRVLDGGAVEITDNKKYTEYLRQHPSLCALAITSESFKHIREFVPNEFKAQDFLR